MAHTPGPWKAVQTGDYVKVVGANGDLVSDLRLIHHPAGSEPIGWNNALLMAAAPDLLAACEAILRLQEEHDGGSFEDVFLMAENIAREAISRVK